MIKNWRTSITVSAVIENNNKFLIVEEATRDGILFNQPSGHLEANESPIEASIREVKEETSYEFIPSYFLGVYMCQAISKKDDNHVSYLRLSFCGSVGKFYNEQLDNGIIKAHWLDYAEIIELDKQHKLRSPLVISCLNDYINGRKLDLSSIYCHNSIYINK